MPGRAGPPPRHPIPGRAAALGAAVLALACAGEPQDPDPTMEGAAGTDEAPAVDAQPPAGEPADGRIVDLLAGGEVVFGIFSGDHTAEQGAELVRTTDPDFVFYSLESGPFDMDAMAAYMDGMREAAGPEGPPPVALRIPPIRDGREEAREHVRLGLENGALAIVYPHVENPEEAAYAVGLMGEGVWPADPNGPRFNVVLIEDQVGVGLARQIVATPGLSVVIPGPGDLRRAYDGDMEAVKNAIQTVLAACREAEVPCGITAGVDDVARRIEEGFRFFIVTEPEALEVGKRAAGRSG